MTELKLISLLGWLTMIAVAWAISYNRKLFPCGRSSGASACNSRSRF